MQVFTRDIVIDESVRDLCFRPYPNGPRPSHPKGCPNYGKRPMCPPKCPLITDVFDLSKGIWIVWIEFDFEAHCRRMRRKHPKWTQRQVECCLYWQGTANKSLREDIVDVLYSLDGGDDKWKAYTCPEAMGVNVTATMKNIEVELEWPPQKIVRKVAFIGVPK